MKKTILREMRLTQIAHWKTQYSSFQVFGSIWPHVGWNLIQRVTEVKFFTPWFELVSLKSLFLSFLFTKQSFKQRMVSNLMLLLSDSMWCLPTNAQSHRAKEEAKIIFEVYLSFLDLFACARCEWTLWRIYSVRVLLSWAKRECENESFFNLWDYLILIASRIFQVEIQSV